MKVNVSAFQLLKTSEFFLRHALAFGSASRSHCSFTFVTFYIFPCVVVSNFNPLRGSPLKDLSFFVFFSYPGNQDKRLL